MAELSKLQRVKEGIERSIEGKPVALLIEFSLSEREDFEEAAYIMSRDIIMPKIYTLQYEISRMRHRIQLVS